MSYIRKNIMSILLFILWLGMAASVTTAHADVQGGGSARQDYYGCTGNAAILGLPRPAAAFEFAR